MTVLPHKTTQKNDIKPIDSKALTSHICFQYNPVFEVAVSVDTAGILEYWSGAKQDYKFPKCAKFESKLDTDLFEFVKHKAQLFGLGFSPDGTKFATISSDHKVIIVLKTIDFPETTKLACISIGCS